MECVEVVTIVGDDEQATGGPDEEDGVVAAVDGGKIMFETLRIFVLTFRGPRSC